MTEKALVVRAEDGSLMAQLQRSEMCAHCKACDFGTSETHTIPLPAGDYAPGDTVELTLPDGKVGLGSMIAYGIPLVLLLLGLGVGILLQLPEIAQAILAVAFAAAGFLLMRVIDRRMAKKGTFDVIARKVED